MTVIQCDDRRQLDDWSDPGPSVSEVGFPERLVSIPLFENVTHQRESRYLPEETLPVETLPAETYRFSACESAGISDPFAMFRDDMARAPQNYPYPPGMTKELMDLQRAEKFVACSYCSQPCKGQAHREKHERNCAANPQNACVYCNRPIGAGSGNSARENRAAHQSVCPSSPYNSSSCQFCGLTFTSSFEESSIRRVARHEDNCRQNPANACRHCGNVVGTRAVRKLHEKVCLRNPNSQAACPFCHRQVRTSYERPDIRRVLNAHCRRCPHNPENSCKYCGMRFVDYHERKDHERRHRSNRRRESSSEEWSERPHRRRSPTRRQYMHQEFSDASSQTLSSDTFLTTTKPCVSEKLDPLKATAQREIQLVAEKAGNVSGDELRRLLRHLQLRWHPDKNCQTEEREQVATEVFNYVQEVWNKNFKR
ncbi:MAG: uncharacterized protein KVP18_002372 [Porospora cf. gigantea A]|uniref:uncharacterized protein n=1 Tax=Porospora cf. gigantea A TaxID=2853593 RepID=UPI00355998F2|nr:MAG: hypothetical protein KVP18_002372 [Porospora cf. gigantea A]